MFTKVLDPFTSSYISVGCFQRSWVALNYFPTSLLDFFPCGGEMEALTNFPTAHHKLGAHRSTPSRLGGLTSKSNKCHKDFSLWTQMLKNRCAYFHSIFLPNLSQHNTSLFKSLANLEWGESFLGLWICVIFVGTQQQQMGGGEGYKYPSPKN